jgi:cytochrome c peroxidase
VTAPARFVTLVQLGSLLFNTPALALRSDGGISLQAGTGQPMSCATCHDPADAFAEDRPLAVGRQPMRLNTPTLVNRALGTRQFFDRRAPDLLRQVLMPIESPVEIGGSLSRVLAVLNSAPATLQQPFRVAFASSGPWDQQHIALALAAYVLVQIATEDVATRLITGNQPVTDEQGTVLQPADVRLGRELFSGKARCVACHAGPNFSDELGHDTGVAATPGAIKTPTLWEIARTAPYFHDGSRATLEEVVDFYTRGGTHDGRSAGGHRLLDPELQPLPLSASEQAALVQYLRTLRNNRGLIPAQ